jgi:hypothetical protein
MVEILCPPLAFYITQLIFPLQGLARCLSYFLLTPNNSLPAPDILSIIRDIPSPEDCASVARYHYLDDNLFTNLTADSPHLVSKAFPPRLPLDLSLID